METSMYAVCLLTLFVLGRTSASAGTSWAYTGDGGPSHWANLDGTYSACSEKRQSPINIKTCDLVYKKALTDFVMHGYSDVQGTLSLKNNGHTAQVDTLNGDWNITGGSLTDTYRLLQFHFHWGTSSITGSEHTINSMQYPLEMHMVHMSTRHQSVGTAIGDDIGFTVLGVMFEVGATENVAFKELTDHLRNVTNSGENITLATFALRSMLPADMSAYYTYDGSLTTPPCAEAVVWNIFQETVKISENQLDQFRALLSYPKGEVAHGGHLPISGNFRPLQALQGRTIYESVTKGFIPSDEDKHHWGYADNGHDEWGKEHKECYNKLQSPIDIKVLKAKYNSSYGDFNMVGYDKKQGKLVLKNNGHSAQVDTMDANWTVTAGSLTDTYRLLQFHFHWGSDSTTGSEHTIDSKQYPLERPIRAFFFFFRIQDNSPKGQMTVLAHASMMHLVHMSTEYSEIGKALPVENSLTVLGIMFEVGDSDNAAFEELTTNLCNVLYSGENVTISTFAIRTLLPTKLADYYSYLGSLTTPPCAEVVIWNIFRETVKISEKQLKAFRRLRMYAKDAEKTEGAGLLEGFIRDNYRPVQLPNGRMVYKNFDEEEANGANAAAYYVTVLLLTSLLACVSQFLL